MKYAETSRVTNLEPIAGKDLIVVATIEGKGFEMVVRKADFNVGDNVVFIAPDTLLPNYDEAKGNDWVKPFLNPTKTVTRVKTIKLGGVKSCGIVLPYNEQMVRCIGDFPGVGVDVSEQLGVYKSDEGIGTVKGQISNDGTFKTGLPFQMPKTDEDNVENNIFQYLQKSADAKGDVTLKIDGQSITVAYIPNKPERGDDAGRLEVTMRNTTLTELGLQSPKFAPVLAVVDKFKAYCEEHNVALALRGELYGKGIQDNPNNPHSAIPVGYAVFDVYNIDTQRYEVKGSTHYFKNVTETLGIERVTIIEEDVDFSLELKSKYQNMKTITYNDKNVSNGKKAVPFEGVVFKHPKFTCKIMSFSYDEKK